VNREEKIKYLKTLKEKERRIKHRLIETYFPDEGPLRRELYQKHLEFFKLGAEFEERLALAANRIGKALKHGTKVATPNGWDFIENLTVGSKVISGNGEITKVKGVYHQGIMPLFNISMDGVHNITACGEHLWKVKLPNARYPYRYSHKKKEDNPFFGKWSVKKTSELLSYGKIPRTRAVIPKTEAFQLEKRKLLIDPYLMGCLLGDGGLTGRTTKFSTNDLEMITAFKRDYKVVAYGKYDYGINGIIKDIRKLNLFQANSKTKFIPSDYLYSSKEDRLAVIRGLMDTDGSISKQSMAMEFSTVSDDLADGFEWLAASLGFKTRRENRQTYCNGKAGQPSFRIGLRTGKVCPFKLKRKAELWRPLKETADWVIHNINEAEKGYATCIEVEHDSHTFVIEHGIVTHNTETMGGYELVCHLTGDYPTWWPGRRFDKPVEAWAVGKTGQTVRDVIQKKLLGPKNAIGTGLIKGELIENTTPRSGIPNAIDTIYVKHKSGGVSEIGLKSYDQGRQSFEGTKKDVIWLDEECPLEVYTECLLRTTDTTGKEDNNGIMMTTFTPLLGMSEVVLQFLPNGEISEEHQGSKAVISATWDDVPHLTEETKRKLLASIPPYQRDARAKGVPQLGSGAIFPVSEDDYLVDDFEIPDHWPRSYGLDVGWNKTAAVWGALDPETGITYLYSEHYKGEAEPIIHGTSIKERGSWIPGVIDPAARGRSQVDGRKLLDMYINDPVGLDLTPAQNAVESGIYEVWMGLSCGKIKVFKSLSNWRAEARLYRRDEKGKVVKKMDHLMDSTRYLIVSGKEVRRVKPSDNKEEFNKYGGSGGWMG